jgi:glycosyltransferase involved in cell wall biosynthesis
MQIPRLVRITTVPVSLEKLLTGQLKYMGENGFEVFMISSPGNNISELEKRESAKFITVEMTRTISPVKDLFALLKMIGVLYKLKPAIVHTHTPKAGLIGMLAAWFVGVPVRLHTVAGLPLMEATGTKRNVLEYVEWLTYRCATMVYPNSNKLKEFILQNDFAGPAKLKVIGDGGSNGINTEYFKLMPQLVPAAEAIKIEFGISDDDFVFLFIGRLVKDKGIEELITAFSELSTFVKHIKLLLVGPTEPDLDPLSANSISEIETNPQIISVGYQTDVRPYLAVSQALAFPSYREGFPNVPMQAGSFELPCIVTDINGCNEIVVHGANGLIIPPKSAIALKQAMERLVTDKTLYNTLKGNARRMITERYEQKHFWTLLLKEYHKQLSR